MSEKPDLKPDEEMTNKERAYEFCDDWGLTEEHRIDLQLMLDEAEARGAKKGDVQINNEPKSMSVDYTRSASAFLDGKSKGFVEGMEHAARMVMKAAFHYFEEMEGRGNPEFSQCEFASVELQILAKEIRKAAKEEKGNENEL